MTRYFVTGGAGFLGSNLVNTILDRGLGPVTVFDNFSTGKRIHFGSRIKAPSLRIVEGDLQDLDLVTRAVKEHDVVVHLAANSDIAAAADRPTLDFQNGTLLTQMLLEGMRVAGVRRIVFTSGSGVYGEVSSVPVQEDHTPMIPISTYGASKLASETLVSAYCHMFEFVGTVFRFANVVGPHMTHGVSHDFTRRLHADPTRLQILGDGMQSKPYVHADDVVDAILFVLSHQDAGYTYYNVGSQDHLLVKDIADIVAAEMRLSSVRYEFTGGARGWKADVPVYRLNTDKIRALGWQNVRNSREAVTLAVRSLLGEIAAGY